MGKRLGRLLDTCVNESECTDLKIGQEFDFGKNLYWSGMRSVGGEEEKEKKGKACEYRKQKKSRGACKWKVNKMLMKQKWKFESKGAINTLYVGTCVQNW